MTVNIAHKSFPSCAFNSLRILWACPVFIVFKVLNMLQLVLLLSFVMKYNHILEHFCSKMLDIF